MKRTRFSSWSRRLCGLALAGALTTAHAADENSVQAVIVGKDAWLYSPLEFLDASRQPAMQTSINLIAKLNREFARNGVTLLFTMPPSKSRIYAEHLPDDRRLDAFLQGNYDRLVESLRAAGVGTLDLNGPLLNHTNRAGDTPFFFRLDTHWQPAGAFAAAEAVRAQIDANPDWKQLLASVPEDKFALAWAKRKTNTPVRGLVSGLPKGTPPYPPEQIATFAVTKEKADGSLLGEGTEPQIVLMGSSYSDATYGFPAALRFTLQRDLLAISVTAVSGFWVGMESYLRDDAFQAKRPKLLIWEVPERSMDAPPDYPYREQRYQSDNTEWLLRASAWVQQKCAPTATTAKIVAGGLAKISADRIEAGPTTDKDFVELSFGKPVDKLDYLLAGVATNGSKKLVLEASGAGVETRWFDVPVPGNGTVHALKAPLPSNGKGFTKLRVYPGKSSGFTLQGVQMCRQPEDLLK